MLPTTLLLLCFAPTADPGVSRPFSHETRAAPQDNPEFEKRRKEAGDDVGKLWELYLWCTKSKLDKEGKVCLRRIVNLDPKHELANRALGNVAYDGKWFPSQKDADAFKKAQEEKKAKEQGLVRFKDQYVPAADVPFLEKGLVKDENGKWVDPEEVKKIQAGWVKQDLEWISPDEKPRLEKGEWKCGDEWLSLQGANKHHADLDHWWRIPADHFVLCTTCDREAATGPIQRSLVSAWQDLVKVYGVEPKEPVIVVVLRDTAQYGGYAAGDAEEQRPPTETHGLSSIHYAYFADLGFDPRTGAFMGAGVALFDSSTENGPKYGNHAVRQALGQSFGEAIDPSPRALEMILKTKKPDAKAFWAEKKLPAWMRWGAATYAERYFIDTSVGASGNNHWARDWSVQNLAGHGGLRPLKDVFACNITNEGGEDSTKLINETGLVMSFIVDGGCAPVKDKFKALQAAIKAGKDSKANAAAADAVEAEVIKHEADLRKYAGL